MVEAIINGMTLISGSGKKAAPIKPNTIWPKGLTIEQNLIDLAWHQKEFQRRTSFTYTVVELDESRVIGCVYIYPCSKTGFDAQVYFWTRSAVQIPNVKPNLLEVTLKDWLKKVWPFKAPAFPGLDIPWDEWNALPEKIISE